MEKATLDNLRKRDFLVYEDNFAKKEDIESELRVGYYWDQTPLVTIVIPVYRRPELAEIAIKSILEQTYQNYQLILVDDEATGEIKNPIEIIVRNLHNDHILYFKNKANLGLYANWNRCVLLSKSKWVCMVHTDTFLKQNYLETVMDVLQNHQEVSFLATNKDDVELKSIDDLPFEELYKPSCCQKKELATISYFDYNFSMKGCIQGSVFSKENFIKLGGIKSDGSIVEDFPFMAKYAYYYGIHYDFRKLWVDCLYDNFGANMKIWQTQLVYNYYLYKYISQKRPRILRGLYGKKAIETIYKETLTYINGTSWIKKKCDIDIDVLLSECEIKNVTMLTPVERVVLRVADKCQRTIYRKIKTNSFRKEILVK